jgi:hypothetical protein
MRVTREQAAAHRLRVNHLVERLPRGSFEEAAYVGLQDTAPRDALLGLHARVAACTAGDWEHPSLIQTYSPRSAVYVLPAKDFGVFTLGRLPLDPAAVRRIDVLAEDVCRALGGRELRGTNLPGVRAACASGRIAVRWDTRSVWVREVPRPSIDADEARAELCRRHIRRFGPTTPKTFAWWSGLSPADAAVVWQAVSGDFVQVDFEGVPAWILREHEEPLQSPAGPPLPPRSQALGDQALGSQAVGGQSISPSRSGSGEGSAVVRLLVASDLRLFGRDRDGRFIGPGLRPMTPAGDSFHPNGLFVDGRIVGAWGRKSGRVDVIITEPLTPTQYDVLTAEVASLPVPDPTLTISSRP